MKLEHRFLYRIQMKFNMFCNCTKFAIIVSRFYYEGNNFKPCSLNSQKVQLKSNLANPDRLCPVFVAWLQSLPGFSWRINTIAEPTSRSIIIVKQRSLWKCKPLILKWVPPLCIFINSTIFFSRESRKHLKFLEEDMKNLLLVEWLYYISTPIRAYSKVKSTHK